MNKKELIHQIFSKETFLCVGLDTDMNKIPTHLLASDDPIYDFNRAIIDATAPYAIAYKPNLAFYEMYGVKGLQSFEKTVEYLKTYYDEDVDLSKIYRYLDKLNDKHKDLVQDISVRHTMKVLGGHIGVMFYDVTTLYFETDRQDDLRKTGFSKEGRHSNPQIILGLLVSLDGYPLAYCIHEGNKYEGHTMLPVIREFVARYSLDDFIVVADSGLMNLDNINELETEGCKYIIGSRIKNESEAVKRQILSFDKENGVMHEIDKGSGRRLLVGYSENRAKKDAHNREKGIRRLEKAYRAGHLSKENINRRGYNKFLDMDGNTKVSINYDRIREDEQWDGLKGYLTNTVIPTDEVVTAYHNLWNVERAFRIAKSKIEIRPMFHFTRRP